CLFCEFPAMPKCSEFCVAGVLAWLVAGIWVSRTGADEPPLADQSPTAAPKRPLTKDPPGMTRLMPGYDVWLDPKNKRVVVDGSVVLREGQLEMFACPRGTKEHEAIVAADTKAYAVHAGLLAVGAQPGTPVQFSPKYVPAAGTEIEVEVVWTDRDHVVHRDKAQDWIKDVRTGKAMDLPWVFAGSGFWQNEEGGPKHYMAESGDFICVSNFPSAMLDLPVESSQANDALLFQAFTERIPPIGTRVRLVLTPKFKK
ncbi:MAG TPA: YdjY domain-containing protein, partial [Pirellulales bacterium]|nr:YdjY domain-containing protein [Pirellulales bacterium]